MLELEEFLPPEAPGIAADELRECAVCDAKLPLNKYPLRCGKPIGRNCQACQLALEAFQRQMRAAWKDDYKSRYDQFKRESKSLWKQRVLLLRSDAPKGESSTGRVRQRRLKVEVESLQTSKVRSHNNLAHRRRKLMTSLQYIHHKTNPLHGGFSEDQASKMWLELNKTAKKRDHKGVVKGESGHLRLLVSLSSSELSEDCEGVKDEHIVGTKPKRPGQLDGIAQDRGAACWETTVGLEHNLCKLHLVCFLRFLNSGGL